MSARALHYREFILQTLALKTEWSGVMNQSFPEAFAGRNAVHSPAGAGHTDGFS